MTDTPLKHNLHLAQCEGGVHSLSNQSPVVAALYGEQAGIPYNIIF